MTPEMNLTFEMFIRKAFSINSYNMINRYGDPAGLANTDMFNFGEIEKVKAGAAYSAQICNKHIVNNCNISDDESNDMDRIVKDMINAEDKIRIFELIKEFNQKYDKYIKFKWNE
uniref:hypothetical protein n=1 Tax=Acetivibrio cellulolyticus TaxID=35830 RepID=UPI0001E2BDC3|nr:hypothetical protein [Acetivibrio cellulolyticus]